MSKFDDWEWRARSKWGDKLDTSQLDPRFISAYNSGERVRVEDYGMVRTGTVGITTGWRPVFLLLFTWRSLGSWFTLGDCSQFTTKKCGYLED